MATDLDREQVAAQRTAPVQKPTQTPNDENGWPTVVQPAVRYRDETGPSAGPEGADMALAPGRVRWGAVWAGLFTALTVFVLLSVLGLAIGLSNVNGGTIVSTGTAPSNAGRNSAIWLVVTGFISFLIGGYVAGRTAMAYTRGLAALHGLMVFFLAVPLIVWLAAMAASGNLGNLGVTVRDNLRLLQTAPTGAAARDAAWWTLIGLVAALVAGTLGGMFGVRTRRRYS
jgi:hypothetical protein